MRSLLMASVVALLSAGICACGNSAKPQDSTSHSPTSATGSATTAVTAAASTKSVPPYARVDGDKDNDIGASFDDTNNGMALNFGHAAGTADEQAVAALVKRYYTAALAGDGATACSLLISSLEKSVVEDYGHGSVSPTYLSSGRSCPAVLELLFKHFHGQLEAEVPKLQVARVRVGAEQHGLAILSFGTLPERKISVGREANGTWRMQELFDDELP